MGTIVFIIICCVLATSFYIWDRSEHRKFMVTNILELHWQEKELVKIKAKDMSEKYPILSQFASSFANSKERYDSDDFTRNVIPVDGTLKEKLNSEIEVIIDTKDSQAIFVLKWYLFTCDIIHAKLSHRVAIEVEEQTKELTCEDYSDRVSSSGTFVMSVATA